MKSQDSNNTTFINSFRQINFDAQTSTNLQVFTLVLWVYWQIHNNDKEKKKTPMFSLSKNWFALDAKRHKN